MVVFGGTKKMVLRCRTQNGNFQDRRRDERAEAECGAVLLKNFFDRVLRDIYPFDSSNI